MAFPTYATDSETHETTASTGAYSITLPTWANGDLMILICGCVRSGTGGATETVSTPPSGYTLIDSIVQAGDGTHRSVSIYAYYRKMVTGDTNPSITWSSNGIRFVNGFVFSAGTYDTANPVSAAVAKTSGTSGGATQQTWSPAQDATGVESVLSHGNDTYTTPSGWTLGHASANTNISFRNDYDTSGTSGGGNKASVSVGTPASTYCVLRVGARGVSGVTYTKSGEADAGSILSGAKGVSLGKTGSGIAGSVASGADATTHARTGSGIAGSVASGADATTHARTGAGIAGSLLSGADASTFNRTGAGIAGSILSGADVSTHARAGSGIAGSVASGADASTLNRTGSGIAGSVLSGGDASTFNRTGSGIAGSVLSGVASKVSGGGTTYQKSGEADAGSVLSGADVTTHVETGAGIAGSVLSGADATTHVETGAGVAGSVVSGAKETTHVKSGVTAAGTVLSGVSQKIYTKTGTASAGSNVKGADVYSAIRGVSVSAQAVSSGASSGGTAAYVFKTDHLTVSGVSTNVLVLTPLVPA